MFSAWREVCDEHALLKEVRSIVDLASRRINPKAPLWQFLTWAAAWADRRDPYAALRREVAALAASFRRHAGWVVSRVATDLCGDTARCSSCSAWDRDSCRLAMSARTAGGSRSREFRPRPPSRAEMDACRSVCLKEFVGSDAHPTSVLEFCRPQRVARSGPRRIPTRVSPHTHTIHGSR
jgi:hypothetical protein